MTELYRPFFIGKPFVEGLDQAFLLSNDRAGLEKWLSADFDLWGRPALSFPVPANALASSGRNCYNPRHQQAFYCRHAREVDFLPDFWRQW